MKETNSATQQNNETNKSEEHCAPSCSRTVTEHILTVSLKRNSDPNGEPNVLNKIS